MMNDVVQWRQVLLPETNLATPSPEKSQQHKKNLTTDIDFFPNFS